MKSKSCSTLSSIAIALAASSGGASCSAVNDASPENLGDTSAELTPVVSSDAPFSTLASEFLGTWEGTAEDPLALLADPDGAPPVYRFPSGSSRFRLELVLEPGSFSVLTGKLIFGEGDPVPPPVDPNAGFPVGVSYIDLLNYDPDNDLAWNTDQRLPLTEGFEYPATRHLLATELAPDGGGWENLADGILKLSFHTTEILRDWCSLETPHPNDLGGYDCNGGLPFFEQDGSCSLLSYAPDCTGPGCDLGPVDCDKAFLCRYEHCACNSSVCAVNATQSAEFRSRAELSLRRSGDELVGVVDNAVFLNSRGLATPLGRVRLQRVE